MAATLGAAAARADTSLEVVAASVALGDGVYELDARIALRLPDDARRAIEGGLTLRLVYEIEIDRVRRFMPDAGIAQLAQTFELSYHALSQRYLLRNLNTGEQHDFGALQPALERLSELRGLPLIDAALAENGSTYEGRLRAVLTLSSAPDYLSWLLFWTDDWSASSEWYTWPLRR